MTQQAQEPGNVALGIFIGTDDIVGEVHVETHNGDVYTFPNMNVTVLKRILPESGRVLEGMPCLVMVNASVASLSIPFRIIEKVTADCEVLWHAAE